MVVLAAEAELRGLFIFRATRSGLETAGAGLGSKLMTVEAGLVEVLGRGAANRLLRVRVLETAVLVVVDEAGTVEVNEGEDFSGSGTRQGQRNMVRL